MVNGVEVRAADVDWLKTSGVYVGVPHRENGATIYHPDFVCQLDREKVRSALKGQALYVDPNHEEDALWLIGEFEIPPGEKLGCEGWKHLVRRGCGVPMTVTMTGVVVMLRSGELSSSGQRTPTTTDARVFKSRAR